MHQTYKCPVCGRKLIVEPEHHAVRLKCDHCHNSWMAGESEESILTYLAYLEKQPRPAGRPWGRDKSFDLPCIAFALLVLGGLLGDGGFITALITLSVLAFWYVFILSPPP